MKPVLLVIAGPNGAGKTTLTERLRKDRWSEGVEYLNPDEIARDRFGDWNSPAAVLEAARWTTARREELLAAGHAVELISTSRQPDMPGVPVRRVPVLRHPSVLRLLSFALAARRAARRGGYDIVQSHERGLSQDVYRAGEGSHRAYLEAMGRRAGLDPYHRLVFTLERRIFQLRAARHVVAISARGKADIQERYDTPDFGNIKKGVGLYLDAGRPIVARGIRLVTPKDGWDVSFYVARDRVPPSLNGWTLVGGGTMDATRKVFGLDTAGKPARYYLIWITSLTEGATGGSSAAISEVKLLS